jgi:hypothetical protein
MAFRWIPHIFLPLDLTTSLLQEWSETFVFWAETIVFVSKCDNCTGTCVGLCMKFDATVEPALTGRPSKSI